MSFLFVGLGGFLGAILRYGVSLILPATGLPWSTLLVNGVGCTAIGALATLKNDLSPSLYLFLVPGFLGALTTFSAFGLETIKLVQSEQWNLAALNVALNLSVGLLSVYWITRHANLTGGTL